MRTPLAGMLSVLVAIGITGCTGQMSASKTLSWYVGQGSKLDDCGPASAAMAVNWAGGQSSLRHARAVTRDSGWWLFKDIAAHLQQKDIATEQVSLQDLRVLLAQGHGAIMRTSVLGVPHYVFVSDLNEKGKLLVADPLQGRKRMSVKRLQRIAVDKVMLAVRNTPEQPVSQFDLDDLPWMRSKRATIRIPKRTMIEKHPAGHIY